MAFVSPPPKRGIQLETTDPPKTCENFTRYQTKTYFKARRINRQQVVRAHTSHSHRVQLVPRTSRVRSNTPKQTRQNFSVGAVLGPKNKGARSVNTAKTKAASQRHAAHNNHPAVPVPVRPRKDPYRNVPPAIEHSGEGGGGIDTQGPILVYPPQVWVAVTHLQMPTNTTGIASRSYKRSVHTSSSFK